MYLCNFHVSRPPGVTAVQQGLSKYLTAQDIHISATSTNHSRTPAMVTYSPSNHSPQYKNIKLFLFLVLSKLIQKLVIALSWNNLISIFPFLKSKGIKNAFENFTILYLWQKSIHRYIFPLFRHHLLSEITL